AKDSDDGAAVHDIIGHAKHAGEGTGDGTAHDICWNDLQCTLCGKLNSAFGNTKKAHEQRGDTGVFFRLVKPGAAQECCHTNRERGNGNRSGGHTHGKGSASGNESAAEKEWRVIKGPAHISCDHRANDSAKNEGRGTLHAGQGDREGIEKRCNRSTDKIDK